MPILGFLSRWRYRKRHSWMLFSLSSGNAIDHYNSWQEALAAMHHLDDVDPEALPEVGLAEFDAKGMPVAMHPGEQFRSGITPEMRALFVEAQKAIAAGDVNALADLLCCDAEKMWDEMTQQK